MKFQLLLFTTVGILFGASCSKSPATTPGTKTTTTVITIPAPLPNTVDKTDTIKVMAYNVLGYGDGCQGTTTTLNGYLQTIIQYEQPDLFSFEKMGFFPPTPGAPGNFADGITNDVLNTVSPGKYPTLRLPILLMPIICRRFFTTNKS
jgi:hypothetical protein